MTKEMDLHKEAVQILKLINPDEIVQISDDLMIIADCLETSKQTANLDGVSKIQLEAAMIISIFAEKHCEQLMKVKKNHPKFISDFVSFKQLQDDDFND